MTTIRKKANCWTGSPELVPNSRSCVSCLGRCSQRRHVHPYSGNQGNRKRQPTQCKQAIKGNGPREAHSGEDGGARDARGISVAELARRASIDRKRLWYILDGQRQMRADEFVRLCAVMGLDMQFFLTPELREELSYRRKLTIEEYGTGLCGLPTMRERGETRCNI